ncbi:MAG: hypothetical protein IT160_08430 [Bryobacterales bacterium]|nr:hypothetical protein [Bryobacterales bacterium]
MSTRSRVLAIAAFALGATAAFGFEEGDFSTCRINLSKDDPVAFVSANWGDSKTSARGGAMVLDLHTSLVLKNTGSRRIRGITLLVTAQEVAPGGKASVAVPSLDVAAGDTFPVRVDLRLLRPLTAGTGPLVEIGLDGVLFDDLAFYGPDKLGSRRSLTAWELEARRDRQYFKSILASKGTGGLQREIVASMNRQAAHPRLDVQLARGRASNLELEHDVDVAFLQLAGVPVEVLRSVGRVSGNEARLPRVELRNQSDRAVRYLEIAMLVSDTQGHRVVAGALPGNLDLAPGKTGVVQQHSSLRINTGGTAMKIAGLSGFVSQVQFADGSMWIPSRAALDDPTLRQVLNVSPEEQRLTELYRRRGLPALVAELNKF